MKTTQPIYLFSISSHPDAISVNSLDITFLKPTIDFSNYDYLIITSKQTSQALTQYDKQTYIHLPALCISQQSAKAYEAIGGEVLAIGEGYGDTLVQKIQSYPKTKRWLYLRAKVVASNFVEVCKKDGYLIDEVVVYESQCSQDILNVTVEEDAILIFTSPSSVTCFLRKSEIGVRNRVIVIGKTTAKALPKNIDYIISQDKTINGCFKLLNKV